MCLIHGPPGTGKTRTLAHLTYRLTAANKHKVLITAPSNTGVDNLVLAFTELMPKNVNVVRVGNPSRAHERLAPVVFDNKLKQRLKKDTDIRKFRQEIQKLVKKKANLPKYGSKKQHQEIRDSIRGLEEEARSLERVHTDEILDEADVVACTLSSVYEKNLQSYLRKFKPKKLFDYVLIDEAGQSLNPLSWMGILNAKRMIMAGDHKQLAPTIKSSVNMLKHRTIFEQLIEADQRSNKTDRSSIILDKQYRMNEIIMQISNAYLYSSQLLAAEGNKAITLPSIEEGSVFFAGAPLPLVFLDTSGAMYGEAEVEVEDSRYTNKSKLNVGEVELVTLLYKILTEHYKVNSDDVGVITPYSAQVSAVKTHLMHLKETGVIAGVPEVSTVDGFQGREKEVVIISTVRSNKKHEVGFLSDHRRMNVAVTRAKRLLCIIGDSTTIKHDAFMAYIISYIREHGVVKTALSLDAERIGEYEFDYEKFYMSGVFNTDMYRLKKPEGDTTADAPVKRKQKKGKKSGAKPEQLPADIKAEMVQADTESVRSYYQETVEEYLESMKPSLLIFRKIEQAEYDVLAEICASFDLLLSENKKPIKVSRKAVDNKDEAGGLQPKEEAVVGAIDETTKGADIEGGTSTKDVELPSKPKKPKKKKKPKKPTTEPVKLAPEDQESANLAFIEQLDDINRKMKEVCHYKNDGPICGKNIKVLYAHCKFCDKHYCTFHGHPETHGCDAAARQKARNDWFHQNKTGEGGGKSNGSDAYLRQKLKDRLLEEKCKRQPKLKSNKK